MSHPEFPTTAEHSIVVRWFQIIAGTVVLLVVATIAYAVLLTIVGAIPSIVERFPYGSGKVFWVVITAAAGMWAGATALKFIFPRVARRAVFVIVATLMLIATVGGSLSMAVRGTPEGWEGILSSIVFLGMSASIIRGKGWDELPGRKSA